MHIADLSKGMLGANGIVGGGPPLILGPRQRHTRRMGFGENPQPETTGPATTISSGIPGCNRPAPGAMAPDRAEETSTTLSTKPL
jgi:hypothetical protein